MKHFAALLVLALAAGCLQVHAQQTEFPLGVFTFGGNDVDYSQMKDTLGLTWVQGWGGTDGHPSPLEDSSGMNVMSMRLNPYIYSKAQRMIYEAEQDIWQTSENEYMWNYFQVHPDSVSTLETDSRHSILGVHVPGYMARRPWPSCSGFPTYFYDRQYYYATFRMRITKATPATDPDSVAVLSILVWHNGSVVSQVDSVLYDTDFPNSNGFFDFKLQFTLPLLSPPTAYAGRLLAGKPERASNLAYDSVDIRVYWNGYRTTWLDRVTVDDFEADSLFAHMYDDAIREQVDDFLSLPNVKRTYLFDEPQVPAFFPHDYVRRFIRDSISGGSGFPAITASPWTDNWAKRFNQDAQPDEFLFDRYVLTSDVPSPSMTEEQAEEAGVAEYTTNDDYNTAVQARWDLLESQIWPVANLAHGLNPAKPIWFVPHLHGEYIVGTGKYRRMSGSATIRPPTGPEIHAQINIALAFGAKGIIPFPYGTIPDDSFDPSGAWMPGLVSTRADLDGKRRDHSQDTAHLPGSGANGIYTGYREKWDSLVAINTRLATWGNMLKDLEWQGAKSWSSNSTYGAWTNLVSGLDLIRYGESQVEAPPRYVLTGHLTDGSVDYLYVVNRRTDHRNNTDARVVRMTIERPDNWLLTDVQTNRSWVGKNAVTISDTFSPGEGKLYRVTTAEVQGTWVFDHLRFGGGATLTLANSADITARGEIDTARIICGNGAVFRADTGSSIVVSSGDALSFGPGSSLWIGGRMTLTDSLFLVLEGAAQINLVAGAEVRLGVGAKIRMYTGLSAMGTAQKPVVLTSSSQTPSPGDWQMLELKDGPNVLRHCIVKYSQGGLYINNNQFSHLLDTCTIMYSSGYALQAFNTSVTANTLRLRDCTIDSNEAGLWVGNGRIDIAQTSSDYGFRNNAGYAMVLYPGGKLYLSKSYITENEWGIYVNGTTAHASFSSNGIAAGYNRLRDNTNGQLWVVSGSAFLGSSNGPLARSYGGYNYLSGNYYWIRNETQSTIPAALTYWGTDPQECPPPAAAFIGPVDRSYCLTNGGSRVFAGNPKGDDDPIPFNGSPTLEGEAGSPGEVVRYLRDLILSSNGSPRDALHQLASLVGPGGSFQSELEMPWRTFIRMLLARNLSSEMKNLARAYILQEMMDVREYGNAVSYADSITSMITDDELWLHCHSTAVYALVARDDIQHAIYRFLLFRERGEAINPDMIAHLQYFLDMHDENEGAILKPSLLAARGPESLPVNTTLSQNFPNPYNPVTTIKYAIAEDSHVSLKLYDTTGKEILSLVDADKKAGTYEIRFDGTRLASGVYFYRFITGDHAEVRKMVLMK